MIDFELRSMLRFWIDLACVVFLCVLSVKVVVGLCSAGHRLFNPPVASQPLPTLTPAPVSSELPTCVTMRPQGWNSGLKADQLLLRDGYAAGYDYQRKTPAWVCECLTKHGLSGDAHRSRGFHADYDIPACYRSSVVDYADRDYDLGHMAAAANHRFSRETMDATFLLSNVCPQNKSLNRGLWAKIEEKIRDLAKRPDVAAVWVVTGPLNIVEDCEPWEESAVNNDTMFLGPHQVMVPTHFFKALLIQHARQEGESFGQDGGKEAIAFTVRNEAPPQGSQEAESIQGRTTDGLEELVGLDLWMDLPDAQEARIEAANYRDVLELGK